GGVYRAARGNNRRVRLRRRLLLVLVLLAMIPPAATARPAATHVTLGVLGDPQHFFNITGQDSQSRHLIVAWNQGAGFGSPFADLFATMGKVPLLSLNPGSQISPLQIA